MGKKNRLRGKYGRTRQRPRINGKAAPAGRTRKIVFMMSGVLLFIFLSYIGAYQGEYFEINEYQRKYDTMAHRFLDLERESGFEVKGSHYRLVDRLLERILDKLKDSYGLAGHSRREVADFFKGKKKYSEQEAEKILKLIDDALIQNNFIHRNSGLLKETLTGRRLDNDIKRIIAEKKEIITSRDSVEGLDISGYVDGEAREKAVKTFLKENRDKVNYIFNHLDEEYYFTDCYNSAAIYLSVADVAGLPLNSVIIPNHVFLRWSLGGKGYLDWEETVGRRSRDHGYSRLSGIALNDLVVKKGIYFRSLKRGENYSIRHILIGNIMLRAGSFYPQQDMKNIYYGKALSHFEKALGRNPLFEVAYNNIGMAYEKLGDNAPEKQEREKLEYYTKALESYDRACNAHPGNRDFLEQKESLMKKIREAGRFHPG